MRWRPLALIGLLPALLAALLLAGLLALLLFRDPLVNSAPVRVEIAQQLKRLTGRDVALVGDIDIDEFPWISVVVGAGSFGNPQGFVGPPLFTWRQIRLRIHYSSLFAETLRLERIVISGLVADLRRNADGLANWTDIGPLEPLGPPTAILAIPEIALEDARVRYTDEAISPRPLAELDALGVVLRDVTRGSGPVERLHWFATTMTLAGAARLGPPAGARTAAHTGPSAGAWAGALAGPLSLRAEGLDLRLPPTAPAFTTRSLQLQHGALRAGIEDLALQPSGISAAVRLEPLPLADLLRLTGVDPPPDAAAAPQLRGLTAKLRYAGGTLRAEALDTRIDDTRIRGSIEFGSPVRVQLTADTLDLGRYAGLFGEQTGGQPTALAFPEELLRDLPLDGRIRIGRVRAGDTTFSGVTLRLQSRGRGAAGPR